MVVRQTPLLSNHCTEAFVKSAAFMGHTPGGGQNKWRKSCSLDFPHTLGIASLLFILMHTIQTRKGFLAVG